MINSKQIDYYKQNGYLVVENAIPEEKLKELQTTTDDFVEKSKNLKENDVIYDLSDDHTAENPKLRRLKNPHEIHKVYENISKDSCDLYIVEKLIG